MSMVPLFKIFAVACLPFLSVDARGNLRYPDRSLQECSIKIGFLDQEATIGETGIDLWSGSTSLAEKGGIDVGGTILPVEVIKCSTSSGDEATACATKLINDDEVHVIVGPEYSSQAIPAGQVANDNQTPLISSSSTNPETTANRPYVFRATFLDSQQAKAMAQFVTEDLDFTKACVIFDEDDVYSSGLAGFFKDAWEAIHGEGSLLSYVGTAKTDDPEAQVTTCVDAGSEFLFLPLYSDGMITFANATSLSASDMVLVGGDGFAESDSLKECGAACEGVYASDSFHPGDPAALEFVELYQSANNGVLPDNIAALTYDTASLVQQALEECGTITCVDLEADRQCLKDAMAAIEFSGVAGNITFDENGDPKDKCVTIRRVSEGLEYTFVKNVCPESVADPETSDKTGGGDGGDY